MTRGEITSIVKQKAREKKIAERNEKLRREMTNELDDLLNDSKVSISDVPKTLSNTAAADNMKQTNPHYPKNGYVDNCTFCTTAMALREKGYDVEAKSSKHGWPTDMLFDKTFGAKH